MSESQRIARELLLERAAGALLPETPAHAERLLVDQVMETLAELVSELATDVSDERE